MDSQCYFSAPFYLRKTPEPDILFTVIWLSEERPHYVRRRGHDHPVLPSKDIFQGLVSLSRGIISLDFQLGKEANQGHWKIEVNLDRFDETKRQKTVGKFTVRKYVPPPFEIKIEPPPYIMTYDENISGRVCGRYTHGKPVIGNLSLNLCWSRKFVHIVLPELLRCHHIDARLYLYPNYLYLKLDGCYNFSVNASLVRIKSQPFCELHIRAKITEDGTGITVSQFHAGPQESIDPIHVRFDDYSNNYFKPRLPYYGKVIVTKPDGTPASGEAIDVIADSRDRTLRFKRTFTTDESGVTKFALCGSFTEVTKGIRISAVRKNTEIDNLSEAMDPWSGGSYPKREFPDIHHVHQWFSPTLSYVQLPKFDSPHLCNQTLNLTVIYTTRAGSKMQFQYQVMARGKVVMKGQIDPNETATPVGPASVFEEPTVWSMNVSDLVLNFLLELEIQPIMFPKFILLLYHVTEEGEVMADSMQYDVAPCFENQIIPGYALKLSTKNKRPVSQASYLQAVWAF
ncbi:alpha-2-macroglobulin-like protein [Plakobranchus ocellatus]|uniref:Alpha-2-macroglobulin-like protein n=1 Tax=Plakobranchus ocellatus TaxID=259542 RepID=A0AAV3Z3K3_9GAST|nr:alpha-2-macroglobulin-like protein [Plakobranchus ocellatus]